MTQGVAQEATRITLLDSLSSELLKLPYAAMRDVGPATQTLAGLLNVTKKEAYVAAARIADESRLPLKTVRNHLVQLDAAGWIKNAGRGHTRTGAPRRTCTIQITAKTRNALLAGGYGLLPWWASTFPNKHHPMRWGSRSLLSVLMAELAKLRAILDRQETGTGIVDAVDFWCLVANYSEERHFAFALKSLRDITGLSKQTLIDAKVELEHLGIIIREHRRRENGGDHSQLLYLNPEFSAS